MIFIKTIVATILLSSFAASAAPPDPVLPTGACAGLIKKSSLVSFPASEAAATAPNLIGTPVVSVYLDFDNSLLYLGGMSELATGSSSPDDVSNVQTIKLAEQAPFTIKVSTTHVYALEINGTFTYQGEEERIDGLLIPTNGGSTFFFQHLTSPYSGVCQKI